MAPAFSLVSPSEGPGFGCDLGAGRSRRIPRLRREKNKRGRQAEAAPSREELRPSTGIDLQAMFMPFQLHQRDPEALPTHVKIKPRA